MIKFSLENSIWRQHKFIIPFKRMPWGQVSSNKLKMMLEKEILMDSTVRACVQHRFAAFQAGIINCSQAPTWKKQSGSLCVTSPAFIPKENEEASKIKNVCNRRQPSEYRLTGIMLKQKKKIYPKKPCHLLVHSGEIIQSLLFYSVSCTSAG